MSAKYQIHEAHDLQHHVHFALTRNPYLNPGDVRFKIIDQEVILIGAVNTYYQKQMAQESVRKIGGIRKIANQLEVVRK